MSSITHNKKGFRVLVSPDKGIQGFCKSTVWFFIGNQAAFGLEAVGLPKMMGKLAYFKMDFQIILFLKKQKHLKSSVEVLEVFV